MTGSFSEIDGFPRTGGIISIIGVNRTTASVGFGLEGK
jgi:hypothetical protein